MDGSDTEQQEYQLRCDMAAVFRVAARLGWNEMIGNHNSVMLPKTRASDPSLFLINPEGCLFQELTASSLIVCDMLGRKVRGKGDLREIAFQLHSAIYLKNPGVACVLHVHPRFLTAFSMLEDPQFALAHINNYVLGDRVIVDNWGGLPTYTSEELDRIASSFGDKTVMIMGGHGVTVVGPSVEEVFFELYGAERTCMYQMTAEMTGKKLRQLPDKYRARFTGPLGPLADCRMFLDAWRRVLDRDEPDYAR